MDFNILIFLTCISFALFLVGFFIGGWVRLGLGWISGGLLIVLGLLIGSGEAITTNILLSTDVISKNALDIGLSAENFMIFFILSGLVMVVVATFMDK